MSTEPQRAQQPRSPQEIRDAILAELRRGIPEDDVKEKGGFSYVGVHYVISTANRIFEFDGWRSEVVTPPHIVREFTREVDVKDERGQPTGERRTNLVAVVAATVRVHAMGTFHDGVGMGVAEAPVDTFAGNLDKSFKEAESDALKRAFVKWGDPFGLTLYDKDGTPNIERELPPTPEQIAARVIYYQGRLAAITTAPEYTLLRGEREKEHEDTERAVCEQLKKEWLATAKKVGWEPPPPQRPATSMSISFRFGRDKDVVLAKLGDESLGWYEGKCQSELADEEKKRFHGDTRKRLAAIVAEKAYRVAERAHQERQAQKQGPKAA